MKSQRFSTRLLAIAFLSFFAVALSSPASANEEKKPIPVELKFAGNVNNYQSLFHLVFTGTEKSDYTISIRDEYGNLLYRENIKGTSFTKKFLVNTEELEDAELKFEVSSRNYEKPVVFEVNKQYSYTEGVVVNKIK